MESWLERAVALQQQQQDKADQEASIAAALEVKHVAKSKALAVKLYAATQIAVRKAVQSRQKARHLKELREKLYALQNEDIEMKEVMFADIESSLAAVQQTNRRLELELSDQIKVTGRANTLSRARLHGADSCSDSSDADDSDYAPDKQPAVSMPALQIRSPAVSMCTERALGKAKHAMHHSTSKHTSERLAMHLRPMEQ